MITGDDLIEAGWKPGPRFREMLEAARACEERGVTDRKYILKLLERDFDKDERKLAPRERPLAFTEAIEADDEAGAANLEKVRRGMRELLRTPVLEAGSLMPDACPAGQAPASIPVGGAIVARNALLPSAHGADICCSMYATVFECDRPRAEMLDALTDATRFGPGGRAPEDRVDHPVLGESVWSNRFLKGLEEQAAQHLADQGDGNHFAFLGRLRARETLIRSLGEAGHDELARPLHDRNRERAGNEPGDGDGPAYLVLVTHHGSRGLGAHVHKRGHKAAVRETRRIADGIPDAAAWLDTRTETGRDYWEALQYVGRWTEANHRTVHGRFLERAGARRVAEFGNQHNFVWSRPSGEDELFYHGKGATPAWRDAEGRPLLGLIPLNMAAPVLVTLGRNNEAFLGFAPHGAGRDQSRRATLRQFHEEHGSLDDRTVQRAVEQATRGLDIRWYRGKADVTESPAAYKSASQVREQIERFDLTDIVAEIQPLGCLMAGEAPSGSKADPLTPKQKRQIQHRADRRKTRQSIRHWEDWLDE